MHKAGNYVSCGWRRAWVMWDLDNGHARNKQDPGKGCMWVFRTRADARKHRKAQHKVDHYARLSAPFKIEGDRRNP